MKLSIKKLKLSKDHFPRLEVTIIGNPSEANDIKLVDDLIGQEPSGWGDRNWRQAYSTDCAEYNEGYGVSWVIDAEDIDDLKSLYNKHKKAIKNV